MEAKADNTLQAQKIPSSSVKRELLDDKDSLTMLLFGTFSVVQQ